MVVFILILVIILISVMIAFLFCIHRSLDRLCKHLEKIKANTDLNGSIYAQTYHLIRLNNKLTSIIYHFKIKDMDGEEIARLRQESENRQ